MRELGFTEVEPNLSARRFIKFVDPFRRFDVQHAQHIAQAGSVVGIGGRVGDKMVMIREHRPCLQLPAILFRHGQQATLQNLKSFCAAKMVRLLISRSGHKISSAPGKLVRRRMRPSRLWFSHEMTMVRAWLEVKSIFYGARRKAAEGCRSPRRFAFAGVTAIRAGCPGLRQPSAAFFTPANPRSVRR